MHTHNGQFFTILGLGWLWRCLSENWQFVSQLDTPAATNTTRNRSSVVDKVGITSVCHCPQCCFWHNSCVQNFRCLTSNCSITCMIWTNRLLICPCQKCTGGSCLSLRDYDRMSSSLDSWSRGRAVCITSHIRRTSFPNSAGTSELYGAVLLSDWALH